MRRLTQIEWVGLIVGVILIVGGVTLVVFPHTYVTYIQSKGGRGVVDVKVIQKIDKGGCRLYGLLTICGGFGIAVLSVYPLRR